MPDSSVPVGLGLTWRVSREHTQNHGPAGLVRLSRIIRLGGSSVISEGGGYHIFKRGNFGTLPTFE